jgi:predicted peroxiredoxin
MDKRKIIFYSSTGPDADDGAWRAFRYAERAANADVEAEIVLVGPATGLMRRDARNRLEGKVRDSVDAVLAMDVPIWLSPGCAEYRGVTDVDLKETGAAVREMGEMFQDIAAGAQLFPCDS